jgi:hypothetical protein
MIKCFQLINGQDIIGDANFNGEEYTIKDPAAIHLVPQQNGNSFGVALMPFVPYAEFNTIILNKDKVMLHFDPSSDLRNNYSRMFGSGIEIANVMPK